MITDDVEVATGEKLDEIAEVFGVMDRQTFSREIINDGREPDPMNGLPLETDAELRQRIKARFG